MIKYYVNRIKQGRIELKDVPEYWRDAVAQALIGV